MVFLRLVLLVAATSVLAGCVIQQRPQGIFEAEDVPPPPSATSLEGSADKTPRQATTGGSGPARQRLAVPPAAAR
jgi:hypothetical protein